MKHFNIFLVMLALLGSCREQKSQSASIADQDEHAAFTTAGAPVSEGEVLGGREMALAFDGLNAGDTLQTRFEGEVLSVCQMKGCWMTLSIPG